MIAWKRLELATLPYKVPLDLRFLFSRASVRDFLLRNPSYLSRHWCDEFARADFATSFRWRRFFIHSPGLSFWAFDPQDVAMYMGRDHSIRIRAASSGIQNVSGSATSIYWIYSERPTGERCGFSSTRMNRYDVCSEWSFHVGRFTTTAAFLPYELQYSSIYVIIEDTLPSPTETARCDWLWSIRYSLCKYRQDLDFNSFSSNECQNPTDDDDVLRVRSQVLPVVAHKQDAGRAVPSSQIC